MEESNEKLFKAARGGNLEMFLQALSSDENVNVRDHTGQTPLHYAVNGNHVKLIQELLNRGADVTAEDNNGYTPLMLAKKKGREKVIKLLSNEDDTPHTTMYQTVPYTEEWYEEQEEEEFAEWVEERNRIAEGEKAYNELLVKAAQENNFALCKCALERGAEVNYATENNKTALDWAASHGNLDMAKLLVNNGANITASTLSTARAAGDIKTIWFLRRSQSHEHEKEASQLSPEPSDDQTDLKELSQFTRVPTVRRIRRVKEEPIMPVTVRRVRRIQEEPRMNVGRRYDEEAAELSREELNTQLLKAIKSGELGTVQQLIERGADVNFLSIPATSSKDYDPKTTPLIEAMGGNHIDIIRALIEAGASVNMQLPVMVLFYYEPLRKSTSRLIDVFKGRCTPLHLAIFDPVEIANELLRNGAYVNATDENNETPLHWAAKMGKVAVLRLLIKEGADINAPTASGVTPLAMAIDCKHQGIVNILRSTPGIENTSSTLQSDTTIHEEPQWQSRREYVEEEEPSRHSYPPRRPSPSQPQRNTKRNKQIREAAGKLGKAVVKNAPAIIRTTGKVIPEVINIAGHYT